jgi:LemA protein
MTLMRGMADDLALMDWLQNHIWPAEARTVSDEFVYDGTLLACAEMLRGGITCFNDMYFFPEAAARAALRAGMRAALGSLFALAESYPELTANQTFQQLQTRISALENAIADRREFYNESVNINNVRIEQFPDVIVARILGFKEAHLLEFSEEEKKDVDVKSLFNS